MSKAAILCVDDEKMVLNSLKAQLKNRFQSEYRLEFAESADEAMEVIDDFDKDGINVLIVVSDWLMPGIKGDEFLIKVHQKFPKIIKVLLSGQVEPSAIERAEREANLFKCLNKPWDEKELIDTILEGLK
ncbi:MAG: response regulator [Leptospira sp.]|jgi:CheY-like chemotaxis protein|nr:response regulator [Leptospira sp.]